MIALVSSGLNLEMKKGNKKNKYLNVDLANLKLDSTILIFLPLKTLLRSPLDIILIKVKHLSKSNCLFKTVKTLSAPPYLSSQSTINVFFIFWVN